MFGLLGISIQNFGVLKNVRLGRLADALDAEPLGAMTTFIGPNGTGKSTIVGVFEFLADRFRFGASFVCSARNPGGFSRVRSQGSADPIRFEFLFQASPEKPLLSYQIGFDSNDNFESYVCEEELTQIDQNEEIVLFRHKEGDVIDYAFGVPVKSRSFETPCDESPSLFKELQFFEDDVPFLPTFSSYSSHPSFSAALRRIDLSLQTKIPNFERIESETMKNGQHELAIYQKSSPDPLYSSNASDGTLKLFAYYLLLNEVEGTKPRRLICIEEPENGLYHTYLPDLAGDMAESASKGRQIFVTTHSPYFVNALFPKDVWVLSRGSDGIAQIRRASDFPSVNELFEEEIPLGDLWHNEYLEGNK